jgi:flagellar motor switch protein FliN/FliY
MFSQEEIDAVLEDAQNAVETLSGSVDAASGRTESAADDAAPAPSAGKSSAEASSPPASQSPCTARGFSDRVRRILKVRVPIVVRLVERRMRVSEVLRFAPGTILEFDRTVADELDLVVGNRVVGQGTAVKLNEHFGMRINRIGGVRERIESLGT